jgi:hypothetical protein
MIGKRKQRKMEVWAVWQKKALGCSLEYNKWGE